MREKGGDGEGSSVSLGHEGASAACEEKAPKAKTTKEKVRVASYPGLPHPPFISQLWRKPANRLQNDAGFPHGCGIKSDQRPGYEGGECSLVINW